MAISYGSEVFFLRAGETIGISTIFGSSNFDAGGSYLGPLVAAGIAQTPNQILTASTAGIEFKRQTSEYTTNCVYHYSITNNSSNDVSFVVHQFHE